ncbi:MAG: hypothetical protein HY748_06920 [Elusimicrobia bacterium]|nr:hypothetical protein [Elusimicrobiota bacterium]
MKYWIFKDSRLVGPLGPDEMAQVGGLRPETLVSAGEAPGEREGDWRCAEEIPELAGSCLRDMPSAFTDEPETLSYDFFLELAGSGGGTEEAPDQGLPFYELLEHFPIAESPPGIMGELAQQVELTQAQSKAAELRTQVDSLAARVRDLEAQKIELLKQLSSRPTQPVVPVVPILEALPTIAPPSPVPPAVPLPSAPLVPVLPPAPAPDAAPPQGLSLAAEFEASGAISGPGVLDMPVAPVEPPEPAAPQPSAQAPCVPAPVREPAAAQPPQAPAFHVPSAPTAGLKFRPGKTFKKSRKGALPPKEAPVPQKAAEAAPPAKPLPSVEEQAPGGLPALPNLGPAPAPQPEPLMEAAPGPAAAGDGPAQPVLAEAPQYPEKPFSFPVAPSGPPPGSVSLAAPGADSEPASEPAAFSTPAPFSFPAAPSGPSAPGVPSGPSDLAMEPPPVPMPAPGPLDGLPQPPLTLVRGAGPETSSPFGPTIPIPDSGLSAAKPPMELPHPPVFPPTPAPSGPPPAASGGPPMPWGVSAAPPPATLTYAPTASSLPVAPGPRPVPTPMPTPLEPEAVTGGRELLSRLAKAPQSPTPAPKPKPRRPTWIWVVACIAVLAVVVGIWVVFFHDPKDLKVMFKAGKGDVPMEPEAEEGEGPGAEVPEPEAPKGGTGPSAAGPGAGGAPTAVLPQPGGPEPMADPGQAAIEFTKSYPLDGERGTILQWMKYSFPSSAGDGSKAEWTAGAMDSSTYFVQYKFTPGPGNAALKDPVQYLFEANLGSKTVTGKNPGAKELLAGKAGAARKPGPVQRKKAAVPKKKPRPAPKPADTSERPASLPLPADEDLLPPSDEGAAPPSDMVE